MSSFQYTLEAEYLRRFVSKTKQRNVEELIERLLIQLEEHFRDSKWLDFETRKAAIYQIQNVSYIIGGPEEMYYDFQFEKDFGIGDVSTVIMSQLKSFKLTSESKEESVGGNTVRLIFCRAANKPHR